MNETKKLICYTCYRETEESNMVHYPSGLPARQCLTCKDIIGKGPGYSQKGDPAFEERWFEDIEKRKQKLILE